MTAGSGFLDTKRAKQEHLLRSGGVAGEVADLRSDLDAEFSALAAVAVEEYTNLAGADTDGILLAKASIASATTYTASQLDGVVGDDAMDPPRNVTVTTAGTTPADAPATLTVTGKDVNDATLTEVINVGQTATTVAGVKAFKKVTSLAFAAADGTGATLAVGFGVKVGFAKKIRTRAGHTGLIREIAAGSVVTTGTVVDATTSAPNGTYQPATAADGANDYAVYYEADLRT